VGTLLLGVSFVAPAMARPRDDAMSAAFRCAVIGETRQWLDCYYGAAQPVRAALGMPPAPAGQLKVTGAPPAGSPRDSQMRNDIIATAVRCNNFSGDREWLNCFYAAAQPARVALGLPSDTSVKNFLPAQPLGAKAIDSAGFNMRMRSYAFDQRGTFTVTLDNGEVWRQLSGDGTYAHWNLPAARYAVRIRKGFTGSFNFEVKGSPGLFKVRRLQ
jgi:hypothetical protein